MAGLSESTSVIAIVNISAKITSLCFQYLMEVKGAKNDIEHLQRKVADIWGILKKIRQLLGGRDKAQLSTTSQLSDSLEKCLGELKVLKAELEPEKARKTMSQFGEAFARALQVDQTYLMFDLGQKLSGMAGTGKSTIARTVAQSFANQGQLGASFFFKKGEGEHGHATRFFTTIARDLIDHVPGLISGITKALNANPAIPQKALKDQFEKLILHPLSEIQWAPPTTLAHIIVIDALDKCKREEDIRAILQLLAQTRDMKPMSLHVLVTSRPEFPIRLGFKQMLDRTY
ncbi:MAG: hypothetical protein M1840_008489 [Geoglossum simile]|nr:MAG: hypothetical protein M1840_008489 [Geoglossum simile]